MGIERRAKSGVFGRDFVSGGLKDYFEQYKEGYWIVTKCNMRRSNLPSIMRSAVANTLGPGAIVMPETAASHLTTILWTGDNTRDPTEILKAMIGIVQAEVLTGDRVAVRTQQQKEEPTPPRSPQEIEAERREAEEAQDRQEKRVVLKHFHVALDTNQTYRISEDQIPAETRRITERLVKEGYLRKKEEVTGGKLWMKRVVYYELTDKGKSEWRSLMV
jgi:hypothetical protein